MSFWLLPAVGQVVHGRELLWAELRGLGLEPSDVLCLWCRGGT